MTLWKEQLLQRLTSEFCNEERVSSCNKEFRVTSKEQILQQGTSDFTKSNEQRMNFSK